MLTTLYELLQQSVTAYGPQNAFSLWMGESVTYSEVGKRVNEVQDILLSAGLCPGDRVAILSSNTPYWAIAYLAVCSASMVAVPILPDFSTDDIDNILTHSESKALFVSDRLYTKVQKSTLDTMHIVIRTKNLSIISQSVFSQGNKRVPLPDDLAVLIYTSGTTSRPKGVMLTHYNLTSQIWMIEPVFRCRPNDVLLSVLPLSHTYECTIGMIYPFSAGSHMIYLDKTPSISILANALKELRPTIMLVVPLIIEKIFKNKVLDTFHSNKFLSLLYSVPLFRKIFHRIAGRKLKHFFGDRLRFFGIGGAKLDFYAERFLYEGRVPYAIGYGLTETSPLLAAAVGKNVKIGSTGYILNGIDYRLENINPTTGLGELVVKSPSQFKSYYRNEEETRKVFTLDGFFRTGDLGCFDKDGRLYIKGRLKNMILGPSGENIYPEDIESVLNAHACVSESLVTERDGHLVALVHFDKESLQRRYEEFKSTLEQKKQEWGRFVDATLKEIKEYVNNKVSVSSHIDTILEQKEDFIKTPTKKIRRFLYKK
ncbi:MAG: AMP-binding protein [Alistipes sp.]|nr:AMP-binding protein [Candidatus Alistipes equi]